MRNHGWVRRGTIALLAVGLAGLAMAGTGCAARGVSAAGDGAAVDDGDTPASLTVAIAGMVTPEEGLAYYRGLSEYMGRKVGLPVRLIHKADYTQVNDMLEQGKVDVAFVCSGPYVAGHDKFGLELLGAPVVNGQPRYFAYLIVPKSSEATSMDSLKGKAFAFTDPQSNTGYGVPKGVLAAMGTTPEEYFGRFFYTYSHDVSIRNVATGAADGASVDSLIFDYAAAVDPTYTSRVRIVSKSEPYAVPPVVVRPGLSNALKARLKTALLGSVDDAEGLALLEKMHIERFVAVDDSAYDSIRALNERNKQGPK